MNPDPTLALLDEIRKKAERATPDPLANVKRSAVNAPTAEDAKADQRDRAFLATCSPETVLALEAVSRASSALKFGAYPAHGSGFVMIVTGGNIDDLAAALSRLRAIAERKG